jgi:16S rRNA (uracil1498-N3)-methyltransferase
MELFFAEPDKITNNRITLDEFESRHILTTLKKKKGDKIRVTDGQGNVYHSTIIKELKELELEYCIIDTFDKDRPGLTLAVGFIRPNRLDIMLEKCTELGVAQFILFKSQFSNYISYNLSRFQKILRQAIKQSVQFYLPRISIIDKFEDFLKNTVKYDLKIVAENPQSKGILYRLSEYKVDNFKNIVLAIGPEGGFHDEEIELFENYEYIPVSLGNTRLRTETAALTGISVLQSIIQFKKEINIGNR